MKQSKDGYIAIAYEDGHISILKQNQNGTMDLEIQDLLTHVQADQEMSDVNNNPSTILAWSLFDSTLAIAF